MLFEVKWNRNKKSHVVIIRQDNSTKMRARVRFCFFFRNNFLNPARSRRHDVIPAESRRTVRHDIHVEYEKINNRRGLKSIAAVQRDVFTVKRSRRVSLDAASW